METSLKDSVGFQSAVLFEVPRLNSHFNENEFQI